MPYRITAVDASEEIVMFHLSTLAGFPLASKVYRQQIIPLDDNYESKPFDINRTIGKPVLDENEQRMKQLVSWVDFPDEYNSYVWVSDLK